jgi:hypothetical protein
MNVYQLIRKFLEFGYTSCLYSVILSTDEIKPEDSVCELGQILFFDDSPTKCVLV